MKIEAAKRLQLTAVSKSMKPEMDKVMSSLVTVLGGHYKSEKRGSTEDVYWEFESDSGSRGVEHVLFSIMYTESTDTMWFEVEGEELKEESKACKTASEMLMTIRMWARRQHSRVKVEQSLLAKLSRLASQA